MQQNLLKPDALRAKGEKSVKTLTITEGSASYRRFEGKHPVDDGMGDGAISIKDVPEPEADRINAFFDGLSGSEQFTVSAPGINNISGTFAGREIKDRQGDFFSVEISVHAPVESDARR